MITASSSQAHVSIACVYVCVRACDMSIFGHISLGTLLSSRWWWRNAWLHKVTGSGQGTQRAQEAQGPCLAHTHQHSACSCSPQTAAASGSRQNLNRQSLNAGAETHSQLPPHTLAGPHLASAKMRCKRGGNVLPPRRAALENSTTAAPQHTLQPVPQEQSCTCSGADQLPSLPSRHHTHQASPLVTGTHTCAHTHTHHVILTCRSRP